MRRRNTERAVVRIGDHSTRKKGFSAQDGFRCCLLREVQHLPAYVRTAVEQ
jgi:hypothetical protein